MRGNSTYQQKRFAEEDMTIGVKIIRLLADSIQHKHTKTFCGKTNKQMCFPISESIDKMKKNMVTVENHVGMKFKGIL
jgi:hypothetical protein